MAAERRREDKFVIGPREEGPESDVPEDERGATWQEMREAGDKTPGQPGGVRGDLGDSGPGED